MNEKWKKYAAEGDKIEISVDGVKLDTFYLSSFNSEIEMFEYIKKKHAEVFTHDLLLQLAFQIKKLYSEPTDSEDQPTSKVTGRDTVTIIEEAIPGFSSMVVKYPGKYSIGKIMALRSAIIRLNDTDMWTREQIADWLETLDLDLTIRG